MYPENSTNDVTSQAIHWMAADKVFNNVNFAQWIMPTSNLGIIKRANGIVAFIWTHFSHMLEVIQVID